MKVLYISHQKEESGYGRYCKEFLKALKTTDLEIASIPVELGKVTNFKDETENTSLTNVDVVIQNILPHLMSKGYQKCIGGAILESTDVDKNFWGSHLNMMDEIWYPHYRLGIHKQEAEIPTAIDIDKFSQKTPKIKIKEVEGTFKFYWIGELTARKNLEGLIKSYYKAFSHSDPVSLILKVHQPNMDNQECYNNVSKLITSVCDNMKLYKEEKYYPRIVIIPDFWAKEQIYSLHNYADCLVSSSHGESINYPMIDALLNNNKVLSTCTFATETYCKYGKIHLSVSDKKEMCYGQTETFPWYQSSMEYWYGFDVDDYAKQMRKIINEKPTKNDLSSMSYENVGKIIKDQLCKTF